MVIPEGMGHFKYVVAGGRINQCGSKINMLWGGGGT